VKAPTTEPKGRFGKSPTVPTSIIAKEERGLRRYMTDTGGSFLKRKKNKVSISEEGRV